MQQPIVGCQAIPAIHHHLTRPDGPVRMGHSARFTGRSGGVDDIGHPVRIALVIGAHVHLAHVAQRGGVQLVGMGRTGDISIANHHSGRQVGYHPGGFGFGQLRRRGYRDQPRSNGTQISDWKIDGIAKAHQYDVTGFQAMCQQSGSGAAHGLFQLLIGPVLACVWAQN